MSLETGNIRQVYLIGIGGIGMSALARYFAYRGLKVAGYDSTPSPLTAELISEGISVTFTDDIKSIPTEFIEDRNSTLVVYTPAVPKDHNQLQYFEANRFTIQKRAKVLGLIASSYQTAAVAGTHGKTSTSTMLAHLLNSTPEGCNAFLGGISKNYASNLILSDKDQKRLVVEADEFDRSFLSLTPQLAIVTSIDADHLDIYNNHNQVKQAFVDFINKVEPNGTLIIKKGLEEIAALRNDIKTYTYSITQAADFCLKSIHNSNGYYTFDLQTPFGLIKGISLGIPGKYNVENSVAASAAALSWGINPEILKQGLKTFKGIARRFDIQHIGKTVYIDDYAHHPEEIRAAVNSVREMFPLRKITGIFQPHLYTRTRDFYTEFAESLSLLDELILLDIYPARELPIPGISSQIIMDRVSCSDKHMCKLGELQNLLNKLELDVLVTMGAGNIDREVPKILELLSKREGK